MLLCLRFSCASITYIMARNKLWFTLDYFTLRLFLFVLRCTGVGVLVNLRSLNLSHNQLAVISNELSNCRYLSILNLSVNKIKDLSQAPVLSSVRVVFLDHNQVCQ